MRIAPLPFQRARVHGPPARFPCAHVRTMQLSCAAAGTAAAIVSGAPLDAGRALARIGYGATRVSGRATTCFHYLSEECSPSQFLSLCRLPDGTPPIPNPYVMRQAQSFAQYPFSIPTRNLKTIWGPSLSSLAQDHLSQAIIYLALIN